MAGLLDFLMGDQSQPATLDPRTMGMLGLAQAMSQAYAPQPASRLPLARPNAAYLLGQAAGGYGGGYARGQEVLGQEQKNQLLGAQVGLLQSLPGMLQNLYGPQPQSGSPQSAAPATVPMAFKNGGQAIPGAAPQAQPQSGAPNPAEALGLIGGFTGNKALVDYAGQLQQYNPALQGQIASAKSELSIALNNEQAARAAGNKEVADSWHVAAMKAAGILNVARNSGVTTIIGPNGLPQYTQNPTRGTQVVNGVESPLTGAVSTSRALAYGEGSGAAAGKTAGSVVPYEVSSGPQAGQQRSDLGINLFPGLSSFGGGGSPYTPQAAPPSNNAALRAVQARYGSGSPTPSLAPTAKTPTAPTTPPSLGGIVTQIAPSAEQMSKAAGDQAGTNNADFQKEAELAKDQNTQIDSIRNAAATFGPGKFANWRGEYLNFLNSAGFISKDQMQKLGSYQEGTKIAIQLQAAATRVLGAREAAQIFTWMGKSMPNLEMSQAGLEKVTSFMHGMNDYKIARAQVAQSKFNQTDAVGVNNVRNDFIQKSDPTFYIFADSSPSDRVEMLKNMGPAKAKQFVTKFDAARAAGFAPQGQLQ